MTGARAAVEGTIPEVHGGSPHMHRRISTPASTIGPWLPEGALGAALYKPDSEDINMPRRDLERVAMMIEQLRVATIECDVARRASIPFLMGRCCGLLEQRLTHSWATSLA